MTKPEPMPVNRTIYWPGVVPQFVIEIILYLIAWAIFPAASPVVILISVSLIYLIYCRTIRWRLAGDQRRGMEKYRSGRFHEAIPDFQASYNFFTAHPRLDAWRSPLFGVASRHSYRHMALGNMAYCFTQVGDGAMATQLYEQLLHEVPGHAYAAAMLRTLRAGANLKE